MQTLNQYNRKVKAKTQNTGEQRQCSVCWRKNLLYTEQPGSPEYAPTGLHTKPRMTLLWTMSGSVDCTSAWERKGHANFGRFPLDFTGFSNWLLMWYWPGPGTPWWEAESRKCTVSTMQYEKDQERAWVKGRMPLRGNRRKAESCFSDLSLLVGYFLLVFVSFCVLLSISTSCSPVFPVFCFPTAFLCSFPYLSHISLVSTALFPVSLHLHLTSSLVEFVFKPELFSLFVILTLVVSPVFIHLSPACLCLFPSLLVSSVYLICSLCFLVFP